VSTEARQELIARAGLAARLQQNDYDRFEDAAAEYFGVNRTAMRCMEVLDRAGQLTAGEIARQTGLTSGAVTAMVDRLERAGYVRRLRDTGDRRRVLVELTDRARQVTQEIYGPLATAMTEFERYSDDELRLIGDFLRLSGELLGVHTARIEAQRRRRDGGSDGAAAGEPAPARRSP
jgi:DNA-binding MarR family transcriptional regulator